MLLWIYKYCDWDFQARPREYLREPIVADVLRNMEVNEKHGFLWMFGSLDCTYWAWKNCPMDWQYRYKNKNGKRSLVMEAIVTKDLWIWRVFVGIPRSLNDIDVVSCSPLMVNYLWGVAPHAKFKVKNQVYHVCYLLADGIYLDWTLFQKTIFDLTARWKEEWYVNMQEVLWKDVEWALGSCKPVGEWCGIHHNYRVKQRWNVFGRHVWSCTTWSLNKKEETQWRIQIVGRHQRQLRWRICQFQYHFR